MHKNTSIDSLTFHCQSGLLDSIPGAVDLQNKMRVTWKSVLMVLLMCVDRLSVSGSYCRALNPLSVPSLKSTLEHLMKCAWLGQGDSQNNTDRMILTVTDMITKYTV